MQKALFLDRDGVLIEDSGYVKDARKVVLKESILDLLDRASAEGYCILVVTNQSGLGRGWITLDEYKAVTLRMLELLDQRARLIGHIYFAPYFAGAPVALADSLTLDFSTWGVGQSGAFEPDWRKPEIGMILRAANQHSLDLKKSLMVGDRATDVLLGLKAGLAKSFLLKTDVIEHERDELKRALATGLWPNGNWTEVEEFSKIELSLGLTR